MTASLTPVEMACVLMGSIAISAIAHLALLVISAKSVSKLRERNVFKLICLIQSGGLATAVFSCNNRWAILIGPGPIMWLM